MDPRARWIRTWSHLGASVPEGLLEALVSAYGEPHRAYHTMAHLSECFDRLDEAPVQARAPGRLELALWFHDAIYDTRASDSEARSAAWARSALSALPADDLDTVERLILVTKHDALPRTPDEELLLDLDLGILGASAPRFAEYESQVRREYAWVPEEAYRAARSKILRDFLERPALYHTSHFHEALEDRARRNLHTSLERLAG